MSRKILVVEDHADTRELLARLLELEDFRVVTAPDGVAALESVESEDPDIVITDVGMPNLDGIEMIRALRSKSKFESLPIVSMTAYGQSLASESLTAGADSALTKPLEFEQLINSIKLLIARELDAPLDPHPSSSQRATAKSPGDGCEPGGLFPQPE